MFGACLLAIVWLIICDDIVIVGRCTWHKYGANIGLCVLALGMLVMCFQAGTHTFSATAPMLWQLPSKMAKLIGDKGSGELCGLAFVNIGLVKLLKPAILQMSLLDEEQGFLSSTMGKAVDKVFNSTCNITDMKAKYGDEEMPGFDLAADLESVLVAFSIGSLLYLDLAKPKGD